MSPKGKKEKRGKKEEQITNCCPAFDEILSFFLKKDPKVTEIRFDVIAIDPNTGTLKPIEHLVNNISNFNITQCIITAESLSNQPVILTCDILSSNFVSGSVENN